MFELTLLTFLSVTVNRC